jgi:hypothetical protein
VKNLKFERDPDLGDRELRSMTSDRAIPISAIFSVFRSTSSRLTGALSQRLAAHPTVS